jgi:putative membrane protein
VSPAAAAPGAEVMYYGGDVIDLVVITIFCRQWYAATDPRRARARSVRL